MTIDTNYLEKWDIDIPISYLSENEDIYGNISKNSCISPIANLPYDYYYFKDSSIFTPAANAFRESKVKTKNTNLEASYTEHLIGTKSYLDFWKEEKRRCTEGYNVAGIYIPPEYYFYLNYCLIKISDKSGSEKLDFPMFCSMDYYYYLELDKAANNSDPTMKKNMIICKARRKGWSFKNAGGAVWTYTFFKESTTIIAAEYGKKARITFEMCLDMIDFINQYTEFRSPYLVRTVSDDNCRIQSGAKIKKDGKEFIKGRKSQILTVSLHNKPDAAAGYGASRILIDEAGMVNDLKKVYRFTNPVLKDGNKRKGIMIVFGTGGDIENARDFSEMFYKPELYDAMTYQNIYEEDPENGSCGYFIDDMWFKPGCKITVNGKTYYSLDQNGNVLKWVAEIQMNKDRSLARKASQHDYQTEVTQMCKTPSEAFLTAKESIFPIADLYKRLINLKKDSDLVTPYRCGEIIETNGVCDFYPDMNGSMIPLDTYPLKSTMKNVKGCIMQYFAPEKINGKIPDGAYVIGHDPWGVNAKVGTVDRDTSMGVVYVIRTRKYFKELGQTNTIVASYIGRTDRMDDYNENLLKLAKYYNAKIMFENDRGEIEPFFTKRKALHMLLSPPFNIIKKHNSNSKTVLRRYGCSMSNVNFKTIALTYLRDWLLESRLENPDLRNLDLILDKGLLEELIAFAFDKGNFDRIMALTQSILSLEDEAVLETFVKPEFTGLKFLTNNKWFNNVRET